MVFLAKETHIGVVRALILEISRYRGSFKAGYLHLVMDRYQLRKLGHTSQLYNNIISGFEHGYGLFLSATP